MSDAERPDEQPEEGRPTDASPPEEADAADSSPQDAPAEAEGPTDASPPDEGEAEDGRAAESEADDDATVAAETETDEDATVPAEIEAVETEGAETAAAETEPGSSQPPERAESGPDRPSESIPGAHLEPDLVLEEPPQTAEPDYSRYADSDPEAELDAEAAAAGDPTAASEPTDREAPTPEPRSALDLAADARYRATGKRKTSVARVILRPGSGTYTVNGRPLEQFFPRTTLQLAARQPLQTAGYEDRMDVVARLHGGGVSAQAGALRHGIARALVEADPALRGELKRHGFLTRDARAKERKKAGLKKARKRPQFSKR